MTKPENATKASASTRARRIAAGAGNRSSGPDTRTESKRPPVELDAPKVVALGGGHGLASVLQAARRYAGSITAIVSVADDGGSSGRLRRELEVLPPGDVRKSLVALAGDDNVWSDAFEHRFHGGDLDGHALGNLMLVGLADATGSFAAAVAECGRLLNTVGTVYPATVDAVALKASTAGSQWVEGQVEIERTRGIVRVELVPPDPETYREAVDTIAEADQIVIAPGSLFTSVVPAICVPDLRAAIDAAPGRVVQVSNLVAPTPEVEGLDGAAHLRAVLDHGGRVDTFLYASDGDLAVDEAVIRELAVTPVAARLTARGRGHRHDPGRLATALAPLV